MSGANGSSDSSTTDSSSNESPFEQLEMPQLPELPDLDPLSAVQEQVERIEDPILKAAVKEPIAFAGGVVSELLGLSLEEEPLKDWIDSTAQKAGILPTRPTADDEGES